MENHTKTFNSPDGIDYIKNEVSLGIKKEIKQELGIKKEIKQEICTKQEIKEESDVKFVLNSSPSTFSNEV